MESNSNNRNKNKSLSSQDLFAYVNAESSNLGDSGIEKQEALEKPLRTTLSNVRMYTVKELSSDLSQVIKERYGFLRLRGEISQVDIRGKGHCYLTLKEEDKIIKAVFWKSVYDGLSLKPEKGFDVILAGTFSSYEGGSSYQLNATSFELAGEGALLQLIELRKKKLQKEGLFDAKNKKSLPFFPLKLGVITSESGDVWKDIKATIEERFPLHLILYSVLVQGKQCSEGIIAALRDFEALDAGHPQRPDVIIIARGGGSEEDLMPFNDEDLIRTVFHCTIPVVSAIGHEANTPLLDDVADARASTPLGAAKLVTPDRRALEQTLCDLSSRLSNGVKKYFESLNLQMHSKTSTLPEIKPFLAIKAQLLEKKELLLQKSIENFIQKRKDLFKGIRMPSRETVLWPYQKTLAQGVQRCKDVSISYFNRQRTHLLREQVGFSKLFRIIENDVRSKRDLFQGLQGALETVWSKYISRKAMQWSLQGRLLESVSYAKILAKGFVLVRDEKDRLLTEKQYADIREQQNLRLEFSGNKFLSVKVVKKDHFGDC